MYALKHLALAAVAAGSVVLAVPVAQAQVSLNIGPVHIGPLPGPPPICPYGYYDFPPYECAPYGYYGPGWFSDGIFIGAGPWYHGPPHFHGWVNNRFSVRHGYRGPLPHRGERAFHRPQDLRHFHGNEMRDGRGHVVRAR
ncbi:MAG TPA: hypothetical protein VMD56_06850 [Steroidobacteraceae bacterium]|nr:hypothetical protein [Steroidobacteraceae bacterium]